MKGCINASPGRANQSPTLFNTRTGVNDVNLDVFIGVISEITGQWIFFPYRK